MPQTRDIPRFFQGDFCLYNNAADTSTGGTTGGVTLATLTVPGGTMANDGDMLHGVMFVDVSGANDTRRLEVDLDGTALAYIFNATGTTAYSGLKYAEFWFVRMSSTNMRLCFILADGTFYQYDYVGGFSGNYDFTADHTFAVKGFISNASDDITSRLIRVDLSPGATKTP